LDKARVYAPADGVIISGVNPGRAVSATTVAFTIGDGSQSEILASVDPTNSDQQLKDMFEGMAVVVTPNSQPTLQLSAKSSNCHLLTEPAIRMIPMCILY